MKPETLDWVLSKVLAWREEVGTKEKPNPEWLQEVLPKLEGLGADPGLIVHSIISCEWFFRLRDATQKDVDARILEIQEEFSKMMPQDLAYHVVEAMVPRLRQILRGKGRMLHAYGIYRRLSRYIPWPGLSKESLREPPEDLAPRKRGPAPWIMPYLEGSLINEMCRRKNGHGTDLSRELASAMAGKYLEAPDFKRRESSLRGQALQNLLGELDAGYESLFYNDKIDADRDKRPVASWEDLIPKVMDREWRYPSISVECAQEILWSYQTAGRKTTKETNK